MKRKVTDLKPNEAILISNDAERDAILQLMEDAGMRWNSGDAPFDVLPIRTPYPYCLAYKFRSIDSIPSDGIRVVNKNSFYEAEMIYPATDFIGSEGESVDFPVFDFGVEQLKAELDYWKTRCELAEKFIEESPCDVDITPNQLKAWNEYQQFKTNP